MWWNRKKPELPLRAQLEEACARIRYQLAVLAAPTRFRLSLGDDPLKARLEAELAEFEQALKEMGETDDQPT